MGLSIVSTSIDCKVSSMFASIIHWKANYLKNCIQEPKHVYTAYDELTISNTYWYLQNVFTVETNHKNWDDCANNLCKVASLFQNIFYGATPSSQDQHWAAEEWHLLGWSRDTNWPKKHLSQGEFSYKAINTVFLFKKSSGICGPYTVHVANKCSQSLDRY